MKGNLCDIKTERLFLREISEDDTSKIVEWRSDPEIYKLFLNPHKLTVQEHTSWFHNEYINNQNRIEWICYIDDLPIGVFGIKRKNCKSKDAEVSYLVDSKVRQNGYAREAVIGILVWAADRWEITRVIAEIHRSNISSKRFIEKLGFKNVEKTGEFLIYRKELLV